MTVLRSLVLLPVCWLHVWYSAPYHACQGLPLQLGRAPAAVSKLCAAEEAAHVGLAACNQLTHPHTSMTSACQRTHCIHLLHHTHTIVCPVVPCIVVLYGLYVCTI